MKGQKHFLRCLELQTCIGCISSWNVVWNCKPTYDNLRRCFDGPEDVSLTCDANLHRCFANAPYIAMQQVYLSYVSQLRNPTDLSLPLLNLLMYWWLYTFRRLTIQGIEKQSSNEFLAPPLLHSVVQGKSLVPVVILLKAQDNVLIRCLTV